jgi:hypothetical protein
MSPRTKRGRFGKLAATIAVCCAVAAGAAVVAAECKVFELTPPDPETMNLKDGEHVLASTRTPGGVVDVRVTVRGKAISPEKLYLAGKAMRDVPQEKVPRDLASCLGLRKSSAVASPLDWLASRAGALWNVVEPPLEARQPCRVKCSCNENTCCCLAVCGSGVGVGCAGY